MENQPDIPQDQLDRIQPMVDRVLSPFRQLETTLPLELESALNYTLEDNR